LWGTVSTVPQGIRNELGFSRWRDGRRNLMPAPLLEARHLRKTFSAPARAFALGTSRPNGGARARVIAVDDVSLELAAGETLAIVGESGSGKTTLARILLRLIEPDSGELLLDGRDFLAAHGAQLRALRREMQMVFQDPFASLDPKMRVGAIVAEPLEIHEPQLDRAERRARVVEMLRAAGLAEDSLAPYPHEFSGGQRQRIGIARALVLRPRLVVADEPVSALDVSVGAQILELLQNLQRDFALTYLLISHSLPVVAQLATRIAVMQAGRLVETGPAAQILSAPAHPYTQSLIAAIPALPAGKK
jgi:ABC-type glutathione transport system ATPase component